MALLRNTLFVKSKFNSDNYYSYNYNFDLNSLAILVNIQKIRID